MYKSAGVVQHIYHYCDCGDHGAKMANTSSGTDLRAKYNVPPPTGGGDPAQLPNVNCPPGCKDLSWTTITTVTTTNTYDSDGVVLASSASDFPGCTKRIKMVDSNHKTMKNDSNTKDRLNELFNGDHGTYFKTDPRP